MDKWILIMGSVANGYTFFGPFDTAQQARAYIMSDDGRDIRAHQGDSFEVLRLHAPSKGE
jgi:hypothetical protein